MLRNSIYLIIILLVGCTSNSEYDNSKPMAIGRGGELVVVMNENLWKTNFGNELNQLLTQNYLGLPQDEPTFTVAQIPEKAFTSIFKKQRNCILLGANNKDLPQSQYQFEDKKPKLFVAKKDVYANNQFVIYLNPYLNTAELSDLLKLQGRKLMLLLENIEQQRLKDFLSKNYKKEHKKAVEDNFGIKMNIPKDYTLATNEKDFMWFRSETSKTSSNIIIHKRPYNTSNTLDFASIINVRNQLGKNHIPGPLQGTYMKTETQFSIIPLETAIGGNFAMELRGLWRLEGDYMGGPFINYAVYNKSKNEVIYFDGFVYSPELDKREFIRMLEAVIKTVEF
jgi:hypothetical protein